LVKFDTLWHAFGVRDQPFCTVTNVLPVRTGNPRRDDVE